MAAQLAPDLLQDVLALCAQHAAQPHAGKRALIDQFAAAKGVSANVVYRWMKDHGGYTSGRKTRADSGTTRLPEETLQFIAASVNESVRNNGVSTKPICVAMNVAHTNGMEVNVSAGRIAALMRNARMDVKAQATARNHQRMRSEHPNHVHQIDPSLCLIYYFKGRQYVMREKEFNKNKPVALEKVRLKVWRYVRYDHASGTVDCQYFEAAGENQASLYEFLLHTWGKCETRLSHGVPKMLLWDKGSANTSAGIRRMLDALGVLHETHATHHAWVKGGVESGNWIVERHFESRLKDEPVETVEQLNASANAWVRDYNANLIAHVDSRIQRDSGERLVRDDLWNLIAHYPGALVEMPGREVCAYFMRGKEETRTIRDGHISFVHPQSGKSELYNIQAWAKDFANGEKVVVSPMLLGDCVARVEIARPGKDPLQVEVEPERNFDAFGRTMSATLIGEERRSAPHTAAQEAAKQIAQTAYGTGVSLEEADALRSKNARPFQHLNGGKGVVAHTHLGKAEVPTRVLPAPQQVSTEEIAAAKSARVELPPLTHTQAAIQLRGLLGRNLAPAEYTWLRSRFADGVPVEQVQALVEQFSGKADQVVEADGTNGGGLRRIK